MRERERWVSESEVLLLMVERGTVRREKKANSSVSSVNRFGNQKAITSFICMFYQYIRYLYTYSHSFDHSGFFFSANAVIPRTHTQVSI